MKEMQWKIKGLHIPVVKAPAGDGVTPQVPLNVRLEFQIHSLYNTSLANESILRVRTACARVAEIDHRLLTPDI